MVTMLRQTLPTTEHDATQEELTKFDWFTERRNQPQQAQTIEKYEKQPTIAQNKGYRGVGVNAPNPPVMIASIDMEPRSNYKHSRKTYQN